MAEFHRYAVHAVPRPGELVDFGVRWLGWDAESGRACARPEVDGLPRPVEALTAGARRYGFHGTLKPPFRLAGGSTREALEGDLAALAERLSPVVLDGLKLARIGGFLALVSGGEAPGLAALAARVVSALDHHRAPPDAAELARRRAAGLSVAQEQNLARWGYPYVMDTFRFHFTLTDRLPEGESDAVRAALASHLGPLLSSPVPLADLCLFAEDRGGMFHLLNRYALAA